MQTRGSKRRSCALLSSHGGLEHWPRELSDPQWSWGVDMAQPSSSLEVSSLATPASALGYTHFLSLLLSYEALRGPSPTGPWL